MKDRTFAELESEIYGLRREVSYLEDRVYDLEDDLSHEEGRCIDLEQEIEEIKGQPSVVEDLTNTVKELFEILANHTNQDGSNPYRKLVEKYEISLNLPLVVRK